jgi:chromosome segregation ATPase
MFGELRDYVNRLHYVKQEIPALQQFSVDWQALIKEKTVTAPERWTELLDAYQRAREAVTAQVAAWRRETAAQLDKLDSLLAEQLTTTRIGESVRPELEPLRERIATLRAQLAEADGDIAAVWSVRAAIPELQGQMRQKTAEIGTRYQTGAVSVPRGGGSAEQHDVRVLPGEDIEAALTTLQHYLRRYQEEGKTVIITVRPAD